MTLDPVHGLNSEVIAVLANAKAVRRESALRQLKMLEAQTERSPLPCVVATIHSVLGNREAAFATLERAIAAREFQVAYLNAEQSYASLRGDPRFAVMLKRMVLAN